MNDEKKVAIRVFLRLDVLVSDLLIILFLGLDLIFLFFM